MEIDHHAHQADEVAQGRGILPTRDGRLRAQIPAPIRQAATRQLERGIAGYGRRGALRSRQRVGFSNRIPRPIKSLRYFRQPKSASTMNMMGSYVRDVKTKAS